MLIDRSARCLVLGLAVLAAPACQRTPPAPSASAAAAGQGTVTPAAPARPDTPAVSGAPAAGTPAAGSYAAGTPAAAAPAPVAAAKVQVCALLSAAEVGAIFGKSLVQGPGSDCSYGLDPERKEKEMARNQEELSSSVRRAAAGGDMSSFMRGLGQGGASGAKHPPRMPAAVSEQLVVNVDARRDDLGEDAVKAMYARTGEVVRGVTAPQRHGLQGVIQGLDELPGVGDWAFATNVATANLGGMLAIRGRILEARQGPWHVSVGVTVSPDPGVPALDGQLAGLARALLAKLAAPRTGSAGRLSPDVLADEAAAAVAVDVAFPSRPLPHAWWTDRRRMRAGTHASTVSTRRSADWVT